MDFCDQGNVIVLVWKWGLTAFKSGIGSWKNNFIVVFHRISIHTQICFFFACSLLAVLLLGTGITVGFICQQCCIVHTGRLCFPFWLLLPGCCLQLFLIYIYSLASLCRTRVARNKMLYKYCWSAFGNADSLPSTPQQGCSTAGSRRGTLLFAAFPDTLSR